MLSKPIPREEESPKGLFARYREGNEYKSVPLALNIHHDYFKRYAQFLFGDHSNVRLFTYHLGTRIDEDLGRWFYSQEEGFTSESPVIWNGSLIPRVFFLPSKTRICPCCIQELKLHQSADFSFFSTCTIHGLKLYEACSSCQHPFSWMNGSLKTCAKCQTSLPNLPQERMERPAEATLMQWVRERKHELVNSCLLFLQAIRLYYPKEAFESGLLLEVAVKLHQKDTSLLLDRLSRIYPKGMLPNRFILAPLLLSCNSGDFNEIERLLLPLLDGLMDCDGGNNEPVKKQAANLEEVEFALNISAQTRRRLQAKGLLREIKSDSRLVKIEMCSIIELVGLLQGATTLVVNRQSGTRTGKTVSLQKELVNHLILIQQGRADVISDGWSQGLRGFRCRLRTEEIVVADQHKLNINQFATEAKTYPDAIRRLVKAGFIKADFPIPGRRGVLFKAENVQAFTRQYCFSSEIAAQVGMGRTIIGAVLDSAGIKPVSGPKVDNALIPLYRREDLEGIDLIGLIHRGEFKSNAGRKKGNPSLYDQEIWMSSAEVAQVFDFCPVELSQAVDMGYLKIGIPQGRESDNRRYYYRESVESFKILLSKATLTQDAYRQLEISKSEFYKRFVHSGFASIIKIGHRTWICEEQYARVKEDCDLFIGLHTASQLTGAPHSHFRNLASTNRLLLVKPEETITAGFFDLIRRRDLAIYGAKLIKRSLATSSEWGPSIPLTSQIRSVSN